jgi:hypothetical protein
MNTKSLALLGAIASAAVVALTGSAEAQGRRYWQPDPGYQDDYRGGGYRQEYRYAPRGRCVSSDGINNMLARGGLYPIALRGQDQQYLYMEVAAQGGRQRLIATVDRCTGQVVRTQGR